MSTWESLHNATLELVRSTPIKQRLICAYRRHLASLPEEQLPAELRPSFSQVVRSLSGVRPMRGEDAVTASVRKMSNTQADECAAQIVEIFGLMSRAATVTAIGPAHGRGNGTVVHLHGVEPAIEQEADEQADAAADGGQPLNGYEPEALIASR